MTHEVTWLATTGSESKVVLTLTGEAFAATKREFLTAMDDAVTEVEDVLCKEYERRTGKKL